MNKRTMRTPSLDDVFKMDQLLHQLASYEISEGRIIVPKSLEEAMELQKKTADKFNYFKTLIQSGECTMDFIKYCVLKKNGPFHKEENIDINSPDFVDKITSWKQPKELEEPVREDFVRGLLRLFNPEISEEEKKDMVDKDNIKMTTEPTPSVLKNNSTFKKRKNTKPPKKY